LPPPFRIAVVEADDLMRQLLLRWLDDAGYRATEARAAGLAGQAFDLVVADVAGPQAVAALLRSVRAAHAGPLILLSARFGRGGTAPGLQGVSAVLAKPLARDELLQAVRAALP
jgi:DNA-binding response OmpR family regulator